VLGANLGAGYSVGPVDVLDHVRQGRYEARPTGAAVGFIDVKKFVREYMATSATISMRFALV